ncbi:lysophospholipid acyltransferase family protein [Haliangium sp.]|uniref:lysophospholipid acyltransferase family protein n=1 Tax=Haliangium sp. TaxID=2663208 RepID=UPI003D104C32
MPWLVSDEILERTNELDVSFNRHGIDPFGVSQVEVARMVTVLAWFYRRYFSVTVSGIDNVPAHGRAMLVGNHSGGWAVDGMMVVASLFLDKEPPRLIHGMAERFMNRMPFASLYTSRTGNFTGTPEMAVRLLDAERMLLVFPEGARGTAKLYGDRNTLVRFGTGFMRLALRTHTPIVPFAFVGGGDAIPTVLNSRKLGKLMGVPYVPLTPYLLPIPRPVALELYYGAPMHFNGTGNEDDHVIDTYVGQVKQRIGAMLHEGQRRRLEKGLAS